MQEADIVRIMIDLQDVNQAAVLKRFFKTGKGEYGEGDMFLGIKVPQIREVVKKYGKTCTLSQLESYIISPYHEIRLCALLILVQKYKDAKNNEELQQQYVDFYLNHTACINNWDLVDLSCYLLLGDWYMNKDKTLLYNMARHGKSIWEQRIAMVSTMQWIRHGKFVDSLKIADILLHHPHDLMQKAVGWMLREVGKRDEMLLKSFLQTRYLTMPRTMLRYSIEKFSPQERSKYLKGEI